MDGFLNAAQDYEEWVRAIDSGDTRDFDALRLGPGPFAPNRDYVYQNPADAGFDYDRPIELEWKATYSGKRPCVRAWESESVGLTFDLEGPDAPSVTMPPCPCSTAKN